MFDCLITGGTVIDGTGTPAREADVGIRDGRVASIGRLERKSKRTIDATGCVVAPGFVDIHTHFDVQGFWDPTLSPAPLHGVTTVVGGNCGFSVAPLPAEPGDYLMRMLARVEGMPLEALATGVPWDWRSFGQYLSRLDGRLAVNAGFLVGHSALRRFVMGDAAVGSGATREQIDEMVRLLHESLDEGGLGFSSSTAPTHNDGDGQPVPSRHATREEFLALAGALRNHAGTTLELVPTVGPFSDDHLDLMTSLSLAANRPLNWNVLTVTAALPDYHRQQLAASDYARERGALVVALTLPQPMTLRLNLTSGFVFDALPEWASVIALPLDERRKALSDRDVRERLVRGATSEKAGVFRFLTNWEGMHIDETFSPATAAFRGKTVAEVARETGKGPFDAFFDVALADDLRTSFMPDLGGDDDASWDLRAEAWRDPRTVVAGSDAGAHLDMIDTFTCTTSLLGPAVRERRLLGLEEAVRELTDVPARLYGIRERGRLAPGWHADVVVFDADRVGPGPIHTRADLPTGAARLYAEAKGIEHVLVAGEEIVRGQEMTAARPGHVLRSGRDTETVALPTREG